MLLIERYNERKSGIHPDEGARGNVVYQRYSSFKSYIFVLVALNHKFQKLNSYNQVMISVRVTEGGAHEAQSGKEL